MIIELSNSTVEIKDELTWWDIQEIRAAKDSNMRVKNVSARMENAEIVLDANASLQMTIKTFEKVIVKITEGDKSFSFTESWMKTLNQEDGEALFNAVNEVTSPKKK